MSTTSNPTARPAGQMTLVTGATGAIGSALTALLADSGHPFRVMCRRQE